MKITDKYQIEEITKFLFFLVDDYIPYFEEKFVISKEIISDYIDLYGADVQDKVLLPLKGRRVMKLDKSDMYTYDMIDVVLKNDRGEESKFTVSTDLEDFQPKELIIL